METTGERQGRHAGASQSCSGREEVLGEGWVPQGACVIRPERGRGGDGGGIRRVCIYRMRAPAGWRVVRDGSVHEPSDTRSAAASRAETRCGGPPFWGWGKKRRSSWCCESGMAASEVQLHAAPLPLTPRSSPLLPSTSLRTAYLCGVSRPPLAAGRPEHLVPGHADRPFRRGLARYWHEGTSHRMRASLGGDRQIKISRARAFSLAEQHLETGPGGAWGSGRPWWV